MVVECAGVGEGGDLFQNRVREGRDVGGIDFSEQLRAEVDDTEHRRCPPPRKVGDATRRPGTSSIFAGGAGGLRYTILDFPW